MIADIGKLINDIGRNITLISVTSGVYNPATGNITGGSTESNIVKGISVSYNNNQVTDSVRPEFDVTFYIQTELTINLNDKIKDGNDTFQVVEQPKKVMIGNNIVVYKISAKK